MDGFIFTRGQLQWFYSKVILDCLVINDSLGLDFFKERKRDYVKGRPNEVYLRPFVYVSLYVRTRRRFPLVVVLYVGCEKTNFV